jgi:hypothetical protein
VIGLEDVLTRCCCSCPTPKNPSIVVRLCVPLTQRFTARNWKRAASGAPLTASRVANSVGTSTPFKGGRSVVVALMSTPLVV